MPDNQSSSSVFPPKAMRPMPARSSLPGRRTASELEVLPYAQPLWWQRPNIATFIVWMLSLSAQLAILGYDNRHILAWRPTLSALLASGLLALAVRAYLQQRLYYSSRLSREHRATNFTDSYHDAILKVSGEKRILYWNRGADEILGHSMELALGKVLPDLLPPAVFSDDVPDVFDRVVTGERLSDVESTRVRLDGTRLELSISSFPIYQRDGSVRSFGIILRDISLIKSTERRLQEQSSELETMIVDRTAELDNALSTLQTTLDAIPSMISYWDTERRNILANRAYSEWFRLSRQAMAGHPMSSILGDELYAQKKPFIDAAYRGQAQLCECTLHNPVTEQIREVLAHYLPNVVDGKIVGVYVLAHDITELKSRQRELQMARREHQALLNTLFEHDAVSVSDEEGIITDVNEAFCLLTGYSRDELLGKPYTVLSLDTLSELALEEEAPPRDNADDDQTQSPQPLWGADNSRHTTSSARVRRQEIRMTTQDGSRLWVERLVSPLIGAEPGDRRLVAIHTNITSRVQAEEVLRKAMETAERANAAKSDFLANMSHELRTPLNAVLGLSYLLEQTPLDGDQQELVARLSVASRSLMGIINDVLDLAKIEAREVELEDVPFEPRQLLIDVHELMSPLAESKGLLLTVEMLRTVPARLSGDETRLRQILTNLLSNALKFTEKGSVTLTAAARELRDRQIVLELTVRDTGIGIPQEAIGQLFTPFSQADASTTRRFGGTGLGLSIVRNLAKLMGGNVHVQSQAGKGSEFSVQVKLRLAAVSETSLEPDGQPPLSCLLADADPIQLQALQDISHALGWRTQGVISVEGLLAHTLQEMEHGSPPDVLLIDWDLPELDPLALAQRLEAAVGTEKMPAIVLLGSGSPEDMERLKSNPHLDTMLSKPWSSSSVFNAVNTVVGRRAVGKNRAIQGSSTPDSDAQWLPDVRILVVDDSFINQEVARRLLQAQGARVSLSNHGGEAVEALRATPEAFDVVLMDVQMPFMDGNEATRLIRQVLGLKDLPILALTAGALKSERQRVLEAGMNDFIAKPLVPHALIRTVRQWVERHRQAPLPVRSQSQNRAEPDLRWPQLANIDTRDAAQRLGNDPRLFGTLLSTFLLDFEDLLSWEPSPDWRPDLRQLGSRMHRMKGTAGTLGIKRLQQWAERLEHGTKNDDPPSALKETLLALQSEFRTVTEQSQPFLSRLRAAEKNRFKPASGTPPVPCADILKLKNLLLNRDLSALDFFAELATGFSNQLPAEQFDRLKKAIDGLEFDQAAELLSALDVAGSDAEASKVSAPSTTPE